MKANKLNYLKLIKDIHKMVDTYFCIDMERKLNRGGYWEDEDFTQEEAKEMAELLAEIYTLSHYWYCICGLQSKYKYKRKMNKNE